MKNEKIVICRTGNSVVYKYFSKKHLRVVCKKVVSTKIEERMERFKREPIFLEMLRNNDNCVKMIGFKDEMIGEEFVCKILMEYYEKGNLNDYIFRLSQQGTGFGQKIFRHIKRIVDFFAELQGLSISHRDIKPQNIFISKNDEMVIGDFGCSTFIKDDDEDYTIQGTLYFLSPELRQGYYNYQKRIAGGRIQHCPYKSDVFSLGLVFLIMATVRSLDDDFSSISKLEASIKSRVSEISNPNIKSIILKMLEINSVNRPDFIELKTFVDKFSFGRCQICNHPVYEVEFFCERCSIVVHSCCIMSSKCRMCDKYLKVNCNNCNAVGFKYSSCNHLLCEICAAEKIDCLECCKVLFLDQREVRKSLYQGYLCVFDGTICEEREELNVYLCRKCKTKFCFVCKQTHEAGEECLGLGGIWSVVCKCKKVVKIFRLDSLFFLCKCCGFRCLVCLKSINVDHCSCSSRLISIA